MKTALCMLVLVGGSFACSHADAPPLPPPTTATPVASATAASDVGATVDAGVPTAKVAPILPPLPSTQPAEVFSRSLFGQMGKTTKGNFSVAPGNLRSALIGVALGAKGKTLDELDEVLVLPAANADVVEAGRVERGTWKNAAGEAELRTAARLWFDASQTLAPELGQQAKAAIEAEPQSLDFQKKAEPSRTAINDWAKEQTGGKIIDLLGKGTISASTRLVATSALYFKAAWQHSFSAEQTKPEAFFTKGKTQKLVATMHKHGQLRVGLAPEHSAVDLPYAKSGISMLVVVPKTDDGTTSALEQRYAGSGLAAFLDGMSLADATLSLPKFTFRSGGSVVPTLKALGLSEPFGKSADFSGLFTGAPQGLFLSDVVQRTFVAVDENGTEAAAASAAMVSIRSAPMGQPLVVRVDRPFLFFLHDTLGHVLFAGRVADPAAAP